MPETRTKPWWQSITILAGLLQIANGLGLAGVNIDFNTGDFDGNIYVLAASLGSMVTGAASIYGRRRATLKIGA